MVDEPVSNVGQGSGGPGGAGPGARLRAAREAMGLSQQDLAHRLHLKVAIVEHLESDRFDDLPEPAYVRGYLRAAARALDLDAEPLVAAFDAQGLRDPVLDTPPVTGRGGTSATRPGHRKGPYVFGAVILLVIAALIFYGWYERQVVVPLPDRTTSERLSITDRAQTALPERVPTGPQSSEEAPTDRAIPPERPEARTEPIPGTTTPPVTGESDSLPEPDPGDPAPETAVSPERGEPEGTMERTDINRERQSDTAQEPVRADRGNREDHLVFRFLDDSWVEIHDVDGERLMVGLMRAGTERRVSGVGPFRVFLGNAPGVRLSINDRPYDPSSYARPDNTARFVLERP